jgi:hypothetical protein
VRMVREGQDRHGKQSDLAVRSPEGWFTSVVPRLSAVDAHVEVCRGTSDKFSNA